MSNPSLDLQAIAQGLSEVFPDLGEVSIVDTLGIGFNSIAVETGNGAVFRIARTEGTAARFEMERRLLPLLCRVLPVDVPRPRWFAAKTAAFPLGVIGYQKLSGRTLKPSLLQSSNRGRLADQVAGVLVALHGFPVSDLTDIGLPRLEEMPTNYRALAQETLPVLRELMRGSEFGRIERWWDAFLADERLGEFEPALTHGDFWFANMIVDEEETRLAGVVDWEHAAIGDPAQDLATVRHLGTEFTEAVVWAYRKRGRRFDGNDGHRAQRLWGLRHFYGVLYGIRFSDEGELLDSVRKLRDGPILTA